jgi:hypothetical protein
MGAQALTTQAISAITAGAAGGSSGSKGKSISQAAELCKKNLMDGYVEPSTPIHQQPKPKKKFFE